MNPELLRVGYPELCSLARVFLHRIAARPHMFSELEGFGYGPLEHELGIFLLRRVTGRDAVDLFPSREEEHEIAAIEVRRIVELEIPRLRSVLARYRPLLNWCEPAREGGVLSEEADAVLSATQWLERLMQDADPVAGHPFGMPELLTERGFGLATRSRWLRTLHCYWGPRISGRTVASPMVVRPSTLTELLRLWYFDHRGTARARFEGELERRYLAIYDDIEWIGPTFRDADPAADSSELLSGASGKGKARKEPAPEILELVRAHARELCAARASETRAESTSRRAPAP